MAERTLGGGSYAAIVTHDDRIIDHLIVYTACHGVGSDRFGFQLLSAIRSAYQWESTRREFWGRLAPPFKPDRSLDLIPHAALGRATCERPPPPRYAAALRGDITGSFPPPGA